MVKLAATATNKSIPYSGGLRERFGRTYMKGKDAQGPMAIKEGIHQRIWGKG